MMIIDTDVLIDAGRGFDEAVDCLEKISSLYQISISSVTNMELIEVAEIKPNFKILTDFLANSE
jgi:predicted nucleic acid-binding protein